MKFQKTSYFVLPNKVNYWVLGDKNPGRGLVGLILKKIASIDTFTNKRSWQTPRRQLTIPVEAFATMLFFMSIQNCLQVEPFKWGNRKKKTETTFRKIWLIIGAGGSEEKIRVIPTGSRTYGSRPPKVLFSPFSNIINSDAMQGVQYDSGDRNRLDRSDLWVW